MILCFIVLFLCFDCNHYVDYVPIVHPSLGQLLGKVSSYAIEDSTAWENPRTWHFPSDDDSVKQYISLLDYPPYGNFDALLNIWFESASFGVRDNLIQTISPNWAQIGTTPNKVLVTCHLCNPSFFTIPQSHVHDYPQCLLNRFLTSERYRLDRVSPTRPAGQRLHLLRDRFNSFYKSNGSLDHPFYYNVRSPDPPQMDCHPCTWKYMPPVPTLTSFRGCPF